MESFEEQAVPIQETVMAWKPVSNDAISMVSTVTPSMVQEVLVEGKRAGSQRVSWKHQTESTFKKLACSQASTCTSTASMHPPGAVHVTSCHPVAAALGVSHPVADSTPLPFQVPPIGQLESTNDRGSASLQVMTGSSPNSEGKTCSDSVSEQVLAVKTKS